MLERLASTNEELCEAIARCLKPKHRGDFGPAILSEVKSRIERLRDVTSDLFSREAIRRTRDDAKHLRADIIGLERRIAKASPEMRLRLKLFQPASDVVCHIHPLLRELAIARKECEAAIKAAPSTDPVKEWCARIAWDLMFRFSEEKRTSSIKSPFRLIASYLSTRQSRVRARRI
jgi:hypothetical protein